MKSALISVIIPAYNGSGYIEETILSVLQQTYDKIEVLVIDDGSTDNQREIIQRIAASDNRVTYLYQDNKGVASARNAGYSKSSGEFIAFLDSDDVWLQDNLSLKMTKFETDDFGLIHSDAVVIDDSSNETGQKLQGRQGMLLENMLAWEESNIPGPSSTLIKRSVVEAVGLFDENLSTSADHDFFLRIAARFKIGRVEQVTWKYRIHKSNMHKNISLMEKDILYVYKKAYKNKMFKNERFAAKCFANMYLILAASWAGDGRNTKRGFYFLTKAVLKKPSLVFHVLDRTIKKWLQ